MVGVLGIRVGSLRVGQSLARVQRAHRTERQIPYSAKYFGHKVHIEKLILFGVTHVCAIDGYSGMIVGKQHLYMNISTG